MSDAANITIFIGLLIGLAVAAIPATMAERKGRSFGLWFFYGFFFTLIAVIHAALIEPNEDAPGMQKCSDCGKIIPREAVACSHCGARFDWELRSGGAVNSKGPSQSTVTPVASAYEAEWSKVSFNGDRSLSNPRYQTFLVKKYAIEKNDALGKFIVDLDQFDGLPEALAYSHGLESANSRRAHEAAPIAQEKASPAKLKSQRIGMALTEVSEKDQEAVQKLQTCQYKLVSIESNGGAQVFKLRSMTNGSDFELAGSDKLREFAAQF